MVDGTTRLVALCWCILGRLDIEYFERQARGDSPVFLCAGLREALREALVQVEGELAP